MTDGSGWGNKGFSFLLGFLNVAWVMTDYDGTTHMSEETHDAAVRGPLAIRLAVLVSGVIGWMLSITFCFCLPDDYLTSIIASPTGLPIAQIFLNAGGRSGGTAMLFFVILVQFFTGASALLANARMTYAFARDDALPFSSVWSKINATTGTPVNAVWFVVVFCACLNLIGIGSTETITAIFNVCAPALDLSYIAVIFAHLWYADRVQFIEGPFTLGKWGKPTNILAIGWVLFISVVLFCPTAKPVTPTNMNYAIVVAGFVAVFALVWWWVGARRYVVLVLYLSCQGKRLLTNMTGSTLAREHRISWQVCRPRTRTTGLIMLLREAGLTAATGRLLFLLRLYSPHGVRGCGASWLSSRMRTPFTTASSSIDRELCSVEVKLRKVAQHSRHRRTS